MPVPLTLKEQIQEVAEAMIATVPAGQNYARLSMLDAAIFCDGYLDSGESAFVTLSVDYVTDVRADLRLGAVINCQGKKFMLCSDAGAVLVVSTTQDLVDIWVSLYEAGVRVAFGDTSLIDPPPNLDLKAPDEEFGKRLVERYKASQAQRAKLTEQLDALNLKVQTKSVKSRKAENLAREATLASRSASYTGFLNIFAPDLLPSVMD